MISGRYYLVVGREKISPIKYIRSIGWNILLFEIEEGKDIYLDSNFEFIEMTELLWALY